MVSIMLSPTSLAGLSIGSDLLRPVRAVNPSQGPTPNAAKAAPLSPMPLALPGNGQQDGGNPARPLPRGSLLDLSV